MNEHRLPMIDIEPKSNISTENKEEKPLWTGSDNSFKFNFLQESCTEIQHKASSSVDQTVSTTRLLSFTGEGTTFAFNFHIDAEENMDTSEILDDTSSLNQHCTEVEDPPLQQTSSPLDTSSKSKKKKKKTGKSKASGSTKQQEPSDSAEEKQGCEDTELSTEEQLQRQLDWCIEQLELGMRSQKATPKQKEETSRALKTLRSSKAPLVKKRQVMRAMAGDYRKKMEEEKSKQYKLIQNETASAQVKAVSKKEFPKKSVFHRKAGIKIQTPESHSLPSDSQASTSEHGVDFVLIPSKEEFHFNFL